MYVLSAKTQQLLEKQTRTTYSELTTMTLDEELAHVKAVTGTNVVFSKQRKRNRFGRGNPLIARHKFRTIEDVNRGIDKLLENITKGELREQRKP